MKLLTPQATKEGQGSQLAREALRVKEMATVTDKARKDMANAQAEFQTALAKNRNLWADEEADHNKRVLEMLAEIKQLNKLREQALIPIEAVKEDAAKLMVDARIYLAKAKKQTEDLELTTELLQDKLDAVGQKEQDLKAVEQRQLSREVGIKLQTEQIHERVRQLNRETLDFGLTRTKAEQDINERKTALVLWDRTLVAKEETLKNTEKELIVLRKQLDDQRATLERAFKRLSPLK